MSRHVGGATQALRIDLTLNILDVVEDLKVIARVIREAASAKVERAHEKAEKILLQRENDNTDENGNISEEFD